MVPCDLECILCVDAYIDEVDVFLKEDKLLNFVRQICGRYTTACLLEFPT